MALISGHGRYSDDTKLVKLEKAERKIPSKYRVIKSSFRMHIVVNTILGVLYFVSKVQLLKTVVVIFILINIFAMSYALFIERTTDLRCYEKEVGSLIREEKIKSGRRI